MQAHMHARTLCSVLGRQCIKQRSKQILHLNSFAVYKDDAM